jgi:hypothetical protein
VNGIETAFDECPVGGEPTCCSVGANVRRFGLGYPCLKSNALLAAERIIAEGQEGQFIYVGVPDAPVMSRRVFKKDNATSNATGAGIRSNGKIENEVDDTKLFNSEKQEHDIKEAEVKREEALGMTGVDLSDADQESDTVVEKDIQREATITEEEGRKLAAQKELRSRYTFKRTGTPLDSHT